jgi:iron complex outermembrane receptor protein
VESIDTQFEVTSGYSYQDFRDISDGFHTILKTTLLLMVPVPSRKSSVIFARTNISIADKYLFLSYRRDGTSRFTKNRWANFPAY